MEEREDNHNRETVICFTKSVSAEGSIHPKNYYLVLLMSSPSCCSKSVWFYVICRTQTETFYIMRWSVFFCSYNGLSSLKRTLLKRSLYDSNMCTIFHFLKLNYYLPLQWTVNNYDWIIESWAKSVQFLNKSFCPVSWTGTIDSLKISDSKERFIHKSAIDSSLELLLTHQGKQWQISRFSVNN